MGWWVIIGEIAALFLGNVILLSAYARTLGSDPAGLQWVLLVRILSNAAFGIASDLLSTIVMRTLVLAIFVVGGILAVLPEVLMEYFGVSMLIVGGCALSFAFFKRIPDITFQKFLVLDIFIGLSTGPLFLIPRVPKFIGPGAPLLVSYAVAAAAFCCVIYRVSGGVQSRSFGLVGRPMQHPPFEGYAFLEQVFLREFLFTVVYTTVCTTLLMFYFSALPVFFANAGVSYAVKDVCYLLLSLGVLASPFHNFIVSTYGNHGGYFLVNTSLVFVVVCMFLRSHVWALVVGCLGAAMAFNWLASGTVSFLLMEFGTEHFGKLFAVLNAIVCLFAVIAVVVAHYETTHFASSVVFGIALLVMYGGISWSSSLTKSVDLIPYEEHLGEHVETFPLLGRNTSSDKMIPMEIESPREAIGSTKVASVEDGYLYLDNFAG
eukprot:Rmarinus@m.24061